MAEKQQTLKESIEFNGVGLHTGKPVKMIIKPAPANHWFKFKRVDLEGNPIICADVDNVYSTKRGTSLKQNGAEVHTTEHVLAALYGMSVDNALIEVDGPEIPILDGSAQQFVEAIRKAGLEEQDAEREYFELSENLKYENEEKQAEILAVPDDEYRVTVMVDYNSPLLGTQHAMMYNIREFEEQIAGCRTFVFLRELMQLVNAGLIKGGDVNNAIVMIDTDLTKEEKEKLASTFNKPVSMLKEVGIGILNNIDLRFENEPARHKLLDIIGDLALVGKHIKAHILAARPGHLSNCEFAKVLKQQVKKQRTKPPRYDLTKEPLYNINDVEDILPHRYPFLLVDKIIELQKDDYVVGMKNVTRNEEFFNGHFPGEPIMPGVMIIEAMAQTGGFLVLAHVDDPTQYATYFMKIDKVRFKHKVIPGDTILLKLELLSPIRRGLAHMKGTAYVGDKIAAEGELLAQIAKKQ
jgi:UDP-3-O-[3-hydroxymyristoyl] N-acetylglucosamine deacetylase/3-hydroxyacyl-[acyl-carrier-protein] dehydratase